MYCETIFLTQTLDSYITYSDAIAGCCFSSHRSFWKLRESNFVVVASFDGENGNVRDMLQYFIEVFQAFLRQRQPRKIQDLELGSPPIVW